MVADVEYVGNKGSNIQGVMVQYPGSGGWGVQARRQFPRFGAFSYISSDISSTYHAGGSNWNSAVVGLWLWFLHLQEL